MCLAKTHVNMPIIQLNLKFLAGLYLTRLVVQLPDMANMLQL